MIPPPEPDAETDSAEVKGPFGKRKRREHERSQIVIALGCGGVLMNPNEHRPPHKYGILAS